jgi:hypothetical protein
VAYGAMASVTVFGSVLDHCGCDLCLDQLWFSAA